MPIEQDFPGFQLQIRTLRNRGFTEPEIEKAIAERVQFLRDSGASGEAIDALLKGRFSPLAITLEQAMSPQGQKQLLEFNKSITVGPEETRSAFRRMGVPSAPSTGEGGFFRGVQQAAAEAGRVLTHEIFDAPNQFVRGMRTAMAPESGMLERAMGVVEAGLSPLRAIAAPITAATRPLAQTIARGGPLRPEEESKPLLEMALETGLGLAIPGVGLPGATRGVRLGAAGREAERIAAETAQFRGKAFPVPQDVVSTPIGGKVETAEGTATKVAQTPTETIVTKLPEDIAVSATKAAREIAEAPKEQGQAPPSPVGPTPPTEPPRVAAGFTDEQARVVAAHRLTKRMGIPEEEVMAKVKEMPITQVRTLAATELREFRIESGELTGKRGRPKEPEAMQRGEQRLVRGMPVETVEPERLREQLRARQVLLPTRTTPEEVGIVPYGTVRKLADQRGFEVQMRPGGSVRLIKNGGNWEDFSSLRDANAFLITKDVKAKQPVELKSPATGESAFEAAVSGKPLTKEHQINLEKQRALTREQPPLEGQGGDLPKTEVTDPIPKPLAENAIVGTVEDLADRPAALRTMTGLRNQGMQARIIKTPDGQEVFYYRELTPEVSKAFALHSKGLKQGVKSLSEEEHRFLGKAFGINDAKVEEFLKDFKTGGEPPRSIGAGAPSELPATGEFGRTPWYIRAGAAMSTEAPSGGSIRFANPLAGGLVSGSPLIRTATRDLMHAELAFDFRMKGFQAVLQNAAKVIGGGRGTPEAKRAFALKEGRIPPATDADRQFLEISNSLTRDFARRAREQGLLKEAQVLENYAPHITDLDAMWAATREHFVQTQQWEDLAPALKTKLDREDFAKFRDAFLANPNRKTVPRDLMRQIRNDVWDFSDVATSVEALPSFIKDKIPQEVFVRFMLPRRKNIVASDDFFESMEHYVGRVEFALNFDPVLAKYKNVIDSLPGSSGNPFTEKGFLSKLFDNAIIRKPTWDQRIVHDLFDRVNLMVGKEFFKLDDVQAASQLIRNGFMRGALGPDSALVNLTQSLLTWAENGRVLGPMFKFVQKGGSDLPFGANVEYLKVFGDEVVRNKSSLQRVLDADRKLTQIMLSPMTITEKVNRGIAFWSGMEEAAAKGINGTKALQVGFARASEVVPNLMMSEQQLAALETVARTQLGATPALRAPLLAGRGPVSRLTTMLMSYPTHLVQFMQSGLRQGFADAMLRHDPSRLLRFMATTGFYVGLPYAMSQMGADFRNAFGPQALLPLISFPLFRAAMNGVNAVTGEDPFSAERAKDELKRFFGTMLIPQFRYGVKAKTVYDNIERGYAIDKRGRFLYDTTEYGEAMRLLGIAPEKSYDSRVLSREIHNLSLQYRFDKQKAIDGFLDGDPSGMQSFMVTWGKQIQIEDIQKALKERMTTPAQRAATGLPQDVGQRLLLERGEMPQLGGGAPVRRRLIR